MSTRGSTSDVLVIDDEKNIRATLTMCLEAVGCTVAQASNPDAALAAVEADVFLKELKAAAVDIVAEAAAERGAELVFLANQPVAHDGSAAVDDLLEQLVRGAIETIS